MTRLACSRVSASLENPVGGAGLNPPKSVGVAASFGVVLKTGYDCVLSKVLPWPITRMYQLQLCEMTSVRSFPQSGQMNVDFLKFEPRTPDQDSPILTFLPTFCNSFCTSSDIPYLSP